MRRPSALGLGLLAGLVVALSAGAQEREPRRISLRVLVAHVSDQDGAIDSRGLGLHAKLAEQFRYRSLRVLDEHRLDLPLGTVESLTLPNGRLLNLRAFQLSSRGVLLGVTVKGSVQTDLRIPNGHLVVIGAERYRDGRLVISLEPSW